MLSTLGVAPASNSAKWWFIGIPGSKNVILLMVTVTARGPHPMYFLTFLFRPMATVVGDTSLVFTHLQGLSGSDSQGGLYESDNFQTKKIMHHASSCVRLFLAVLYPGFLCVFFGLKPAKSANDPRHEGSSQYRWEVSKAEVGLHENLLFLFIAKGDDAGNYLGFFLRGMSWLIVFWLSLLHKKKIEFFKSGRIGFSTQKFENYACANWKLHGNSRHAVLKGKMCP